MQAQERFETRVGCSDGTVCTKVSSFFLALQSRGILGKVNANVSIFANAFALYKIQKAAHEYSFSRRIMSAGAASASSSVKPPSAERKQFTELQQKYIDTTQKLKQLHSQFQQKSVEKQRALLTAKELSVSTNEDDETTTNLYKPIGRGFVLRSREQIERELAQTVKKAEKMMDDCQNQRTFLEGKIEELERNLRELLHGNEGLQRELHEAGLLGGGGMM